MAKFVIKRKQDLSGVHSRNISNIYKESNKEEKNINNMDTIEKIEIAKQILNNNHQQKVKKVKKEKGLIERTESSAIILTEDNRELLKD